MAPRSPKRPPRIATGFDHSYSCPTCGTQDLDRFDDLDDRTWTCNVCTEPVRVELKNSAGRSLYVRRVPAKDLVPGDFIYQEHDIDSGSIEVLASSKGTVKGDFWHLALKEIGSDRVHPDRYYNHQWKA